MQKSSQKYIWSSGKHYFQLWRKNISPVSQSLVIKYLGETLRWEISNFLKVEMQLERIKIVPPFIFAPYQRKKIDCQNMWVVYCGGKNPVKQKIRYAYYNLIKCNLRFRGGCASFWLEGKERQSAGARCNFDFFSCSSQPSMVHWLSSPIFPCSVVWLFGCLSRYGNIRLNLTSTCPRPPKPIHFLKAYDNSYSKMN